SLACKGWTSDTVNSSVNFCPTLVPCPERSICSSSFVGTKLSTVLLLPTSVRTSMPPSKRSESVKKPLSWNAGMLNEQSKSRAFFICLADLGFNLRRLFHLWETAEVVVAYAWWDFNDRGIVFCRVCFGDVADLHRVDGSDLRAPKKRLLTAERRCPPNASPPRD